MAVLKDDGSASSTFVKWLFLAGVLYPFWGESGISGSSNISPQCFDVFLFVRSKAISVQKVVLDYTPCAAIEFQDGDPLATPSSP